MNSEKYRSSSKKKKKRNRIQVNEKKNHLIPNRYLVVENGSNSKNKCSYTKKYTVNASYSGMLLN